jgi:hypothetical protein
MTDDVIYTRNYSVSLKDMVDIWVETFHPGSTVLVIWDIRNHLDTLKQNGLVIDEVEYFDNKVMIVGLSGVLEAYALLDKIGACEHPPVMGVYHNSSILSDNIEP